MLSLFLDEHGRVRSGWRATAFLIAFLILATVFVFGAITVIAQLPFEQSATGLLPLILPFAISTGVAVLLGWAFGRIFEKLPFRSLGCSFSAGWLRHLGLGFAVGSGALILAVVIAMFAGGLKLSLNVASAGTAVATTLATTLLIFVVGAASEETLFRGYLLQTFTRSQVAWMGMVLTAGLFALAHNNNPSANYLSLVNTLIAGFWFGLAYLRSRDLWFPFGIHLAWNWLQGPVFGINVSGLSEFSPDPVLRAQDLGPAWVTGGAYGIEGGAACTAALVAATVWIYFASAIRPAVTEGNSADVDLK